MGSTKLKKIDKNRFRKVYPRFRKLPVPSFMGDSELVIETHEVTFTNQSTVQFVLKENYSSAPVVTVTPHGDEDDDINAYITSIVIGGTPPGGQKCTVTISTSDTYTGIVMLQAISAGA